MNINRTEIPHIEIGLYLNNGSISLSHSQTVNQVTSNTSRSNIILRPDFRPRISADTSTLLQTSPKEYSNNFNSFAAAPRAQHSLRTLIVQQPRSRSPLVVVDCLTSQFHSRLFIDQLTQPSGYLSSMTNDKGPRQSPPTELLNTRGFHLNGPPNDQLTADYSSPFNRMTNPDGPGRRRSAYDRFSVYNYDAPSLRDNFLIGGSSPQLQVGVTAQNNSHAPATMNDFRRSQDLSLDEILANIEAGKLQMIDLNQEPACNGSSSRQVIELHELNRITSLNNGPEGQNVIQESSLIIPKDQPLRKSSSAQSCGSSYTTNSCNDQSNALTENDSSIKTQMTRRRSRDEKERQNERLTGFEIAWLDFSYSVEPNLFEDPRWGKINKLFHKEPRTILKGLSGGFKSGQLVALMGPSGAGKTCLLESISGVRETGLGGRICLRGRKKVQLVIVPQYDDFMPQFSVEETIVYGSRMKNGFATNHQEVANKVIKQLGLEPCRSNNIQRCSGGQRKRVAIAQELVSRPNILILDEPTSGLDSSCCYHTMKVLRDVLDESVDTEQPMAIVSTIHQPSAKVFKMFDSVYLLGKTGHMAFSGPPDELVSTIRDVTGLECPKYSNPSDFIIELVAYDYGEEPVEKMIEFEKQKAAQFRKDFEKRAGLRPGASSSEGPGSGPPRRRAVAGGARSSEIGRKSSARPCEDSSESARVNRNDNRSSSVISLRGNTSTRGLSPSKSDTQLDAANSQSKDLIEQRLKVSQLLGDNYVTYDNNVTVLLRKATSGSGRRHPFFWHTWVHLHRSYLQAIRDPILNNMRILIHLGFATLLVMLYGKKSGEARGCPPVLGLPPEITDPNNESMIDLADNVGYIFMCIMMITYVSLMSTVLTFPIDIKTVGKEYKNGWYGTVTYFIGKTIADLPFIVMYPVVYCLITWYMTNQAQDHFWRYLSFTCLIIMNAMNSQSFGLILGALFVNSVTAATFLGPVITIPWYLFTGFTKRVHRLAEPFKTTSKFLFTRYVFEGALDTVYGHSRCNCSYFLEQYYQLRFEEANRLGQLISMETLSSLDYYDGLETVADVANKTFPSGGSANNWFMRTVDAASTVFADSDNLNLASLMDTNVKASSLFSFGLDFEPTCPKDYESFVVQDFKIGERNVQKAFLVVFCMLCIIRILTFVLVAWKIRTRQL